MPIPSRAFALVWLLVGALAAPGRAERALRPAAAPVSGALAVAAAAPAPLALPVGLTSALAPVQIAPAALAPLPVFSARLDGTSARLASRAARIASALGGRAAEPDTEDAPAPAWLGARHTWERLSLQAQRAATLPAQLWPFSWAVRKLSHGEALAGLSPASAIKAAEQVRREHGTGTVIGRLAWELKDPRSVRGAEASYARLLGRLAKAKERDPGLDAAVSLDLETLGAQIAGLSPAKRRELTFQAALRLGEKAKALAIPLEIDMGTSDATALIADVAFALARELRTPIRLAVAARYRSSERLLEGWAALAQGLGVRLGVRLVKGSFLEPAQPDAINRRSPLIAQYKRLITLALSHGRVLDVAVATHNREVWLHAEGEARRLGAGYAVHAIRGVEPGLQAEMRAAGRLKREYVSYGMDAAVMGVSELWHNRKAKRELPADAD